MEQAASSVTATTEDFGFSDDVDTDIIDEVCDQLGINIDTLYVQMASCRAAIAKANTEANKQKHRHWKPPKGSGIPALDVCCMMATKANININGVNYSIKKATTASQPMDVTIDGVTYSVSMALIMYHLSASRHSVKLGLLMDSLLYH